MTYFDVCSGQVVILCSLCEFSCSVCEMLHNSLEYLPFSLVQSASHHPIVENQSYDHICYVYTQLLLEECNALLRDPTNAIQWNLGYPDLN